MGAAPVDFSSLPISAGKTKLLWDAIRTAGVGPNGEPLPPGAPPQGPQSAPAASPAAIMQGPYAAPQGPANPLPPRPMPNAGPPSIDTPAGPVAAPPPSPALMPTPSSAPTGPDQSVNPPGLIRRSLLPPPGTTPSFAGGPLVGAAPVGPAASVNPATLPSSARVGDLQAQVDSANAKPSLMQRFKNALPAIIASGAALATRNPGAIPGIATAEGRQVEERDKQRAALIQQVDAAQQTRAAEYGAQQRAQEMQAVAGINSGAKQAVATTGATAKTDAANIGATGREQVAAETNQNRLDVQASKNSGSYKNAIVGANGRIVSAKYAADAALARQSRSIDATADRQQAGFEHTDTKPTADEDRRADLSSSLDVLADRLSDISQRRPELFGPVAGRMTKLRQYTGTKDEDVSELKSIQENLGQISLGAHSMRNAGHIATAADAMANIYNSPEAYRAGLAAGKGSADTMQHITRPTLVKGKTSTPAVPPGADGVWDPVAKKVVYK